MQMVASPLFQLIIKALCSKYLKLQAKKIAKFVAKNPMEPIFCSLLCSQASAVNIVAELLLIKGHSLSIRL